MFSVMLFYINPLYYYKKVNFTFNVLIIVISTINLSLYFVEYLKGENMKKIFLSLTLLMLALSFSACAAKVEKKVDEPYYDRANQAAEKAHDRLNKD